MGWLNKIFARRRPDPAHHMRYALPDLISGVKLTPDESLSLSAVWACMDAIAKSIASCTWNVKVPVSPGRSETLINDRMHWVLNTRPNPDMTAIAFRESLLYTAIPFGNAYAEIVNDRAGRPAELWPLEHDRVMPRRDAETDRVVYEYRQADGTTVILEQSQVFHLRGPGLSGWMGDNIIARAAKAIGVAAAQERYAGAFFGRGAHPSGVLEFPQKLSKEQHDRLKEDWRDRKAGPENAHAPLILEGGMKWTSVSVEPQKQQLIESRYFSVEEICRWFGVPPHKVQHLLRSTFSNIEHLGIEFVRDALTPWARRLEQEADYKLFRQDRGPFKYTKVDLAPLSYGDALSRAQAHAVWRQNGIMTANEIREREGMNDVGDEGDVLLVQANLTTIENILNPPKPEAPQAPAEEDEDVDADDKPDDEAVEAATEASNQILHKAVMEIVAGAFDRFRRKLENRRKDLLRTMPEAKVEQLLTAESHRLISSFVDDTAAARAIAEMAGFTFYVDLSDMKAIASKLLSGEPARDVAQRVVIPVPRRVET